MTDGPGTGEIPPITARETTDFGIHYLKQKQELGASQETKYLQNIASHIRTVKKTYQDNVLSTIYEMNNPEDMGPEEIIPNKTDLYLEAIYWRGGNQSLRNEEQKKSDERIATLDSISQSIDGLKVNIPNHYHRLNELVKNLNHDAAFILIDIFRSTMLEQDITFVKYPQAADWPVHVMERVARQIEMKEQPEAFRPSETYNYLEGLFSALTESEERNFSTHNDVDPNITLKADKFYFEGMIFNLIRNSQTIGAKNGTVSLQQKDGDVVIHIRDDGGGFPEDLLEEVPRTDEYGNPDGSGMKIKKALQRNISQREGGSGLGLDIARQIAEDHLHGRIDIRNEEYSDTGEMGAVVEVRFPHNQSFTPLPPLENPGESPTE